MKEVKKMKKENKKVVSLETLKNELVSQNSSTSGNLSEVLQSLALCGGVGTPSEIASKMFGTTNPLAIEKKKVRNIFQGKNLKADNPIIEVEGGFVVLTKNVGREKNLYTFCKDEKEVSNLLR